MYVILTSKPGQYRTEIGAGLVAMEAWDYLFCGRVRARFVIAELTAETRIRVVDETPPPIVNLVPSKFLEKFDTVEGARRQLEELSRFGAMDVSLVRQPLEGAPVAAAAAPEAKKIAITFLSNAGKVIEVPDNSNLLRASLRWEGGIPFKCGGGICGTCKCFIEKGLEHTDKPKAKEKKHFSDAQLAEGHRLACQTFVTGDVSVSWQPPAKP
jgi:ferredoxin